MPELKQSLLQSEILKNPPVVSLQMQGQNGHFHIQSLCSSLDLIENILQFRHVTMPRMITTHPGIGIPAANDIPIPSGNLKIKDLPIFPQTSSARGVLETPESLHAKKIPSGKQALLPSPVIPGIHSKTRNHLS